MYFCFFFQAEDGIRDPLVTGVQTCALPISLFSCSTPNWSQFCDRGVESRMQRANALQTTDTYLANRLWARIDRNIVDLAPVVPLITLKQVDIVSRRVGNYQYTPQWGVLLGQLWVR